MLSVSVTGRSRYSVRCYKVRYVSRRQAFGLAKRKAVGVTDSHCLTLTIAVGSSDEGPLGGGLLLPVFGQDLLIAHAQIDPKLDRSVAN